MEFNQQFQVNLAIWQELLPEIWLAFSLIGLIILAAFPTTTRWIFWVFTLAIAINIGLLLAFPTVFNLFKLFFAVAVWASGGLACREPETKTNGVYFALLVLLLLAMQLPFFTGNLLLLYLCLEVVSISSYLLVIFRKGYVATEAGIKYFLFGAAASGCMLYGMTWFYGFANSLSLTTIAAQISSVPPLPFYTAALLILVSLLFKVALVPLHAWVTDVYEGSAASLVALLTNVSKAFGLAILCLFAYFLQAQTAVLLNFSLFLQFVALVSLVIGTLGAIWQQNPKRLLAYSSILHSGLLVVFLVALLLPFTLRPSPTLLSIQAFFGQTVVKQMTYYFWVYALLNFVILYGVALLETDKQQLDLQDFAGLGKSNFAIGLAFLAGFAGLAGLPPTAGFTAKLLVFTNLLEIYTQTHQPLTLALLVVATLSGSIALFFYMKFPYFLFFKSVATTHKPLVIKKIDYFVFGFCVLCLLLLFFAPNWVM